LGFRTVNVSFVEEADPDINDQIDAARSPV
jgi:hypothetical protein